ncbi:hypothetical protein [Brachybacterium paraconglomeratum]|uniref:hypothetical protein n=1 Tax=Brachybacterium paraconglomeratum TaxID=173362 RepID=UPI00223B0769|nr:hypothetical protein [Brachybacterium paraconglomeratum]MCT1435939.1 hypothetical protein [Brachybacterium paraconglomeratum]
MSDYKLVRKGDLVLNKMKTWQGSLGVSPYEGIVSPAYFVCELSTRVHGRFLHHLLRSRRYIAHYEAGSKGIRTNQWDLPYDVLRQIPVLLPPMDEQRRIAGFLDDRVSRIDRIIAARREQTDLVSESRSRASYDVIRGATVTGGRKESQLDWLGEIPTTWGVLSVGSQFTIELGKMLDDKRQTGAHSLPYLRNTNVQWDKIDIEDLKEMDIPETEYSRYTVKPGDLMICEGGQPGRAAIWEGDVAPLGFQKALHRARSRGRSTPDWLLECLRVAADLNIFAGPSGQTTIAHLTNEQLRSQRFPFPERNVQVRLLGELEERREAMTSTIDGIAKSINLLIEYKSSLINAAVTGELDVSTAGSNIPG